MKILGSKKHFSPVVIGCLAGLSISIGVIAYSYDYAVGHDPSILNFQHYLFQKPYRPLQFGVSILPVVVGYFFGRSRERLLALRALYYEAVVEKARLEEGLKIDVKSFVPESLQKLTEREREILQLVCRGLANKEIAGVLFISEKTVKNHINSIFRKLEVSDRTNAALMGLNEGLATRDRLQDPTI